MDRQTLIDRIDRLLAAPLPHDAGENITAAIMELHQATLTLIRAIHGPEALHFNTLTDAMQKARKWASGNDHSGLQISLYPALQGTLRSLKGDLEGGLIGNLEQRVTGEVLGDMLWMAREALREKTEGAKNVAAVLVAAAFEDTIRKMGAALAGITDRRGLAEIMTALKSAGVMAGASFTTGQSYLKFRNDALHADWDHIDAATVASCLSFVEGLLLKHFS